MGGEAANALTQAREVARVVGARRRCPAATHRARYVEAAALDALGRPRRGHGLPAACSTGDPDSATAPQGGDRAVPDLARAGPAGARDRLRAGGAGRPRARDARQRGGHPADGDPRGGPVHGRPDRSRRPSSATGPSRSPSGSARRWRGPRRTGTPASIRAESGDVDRGHRDGHGARCTCWRTPSGSATSAGCAPSSARSCCQADPPRVEDAKRAARDRRHRARLERGQPHRPGPQRPGQRPGAVPRGRRSTQAARPGRCRVLDAASDELPLLERRGADAARPDRLDLGRGRGGPRPGTGGRSPILTGVGRRPRGRHRSGSSSATLAAEAGLTAEARRRLPAGGGLDRPAGPPAGGRRSRPRRRRAPRRRPRRRDRSPRRAPAGRAVAPRGAVGSSTMPVQRPSRGGEPCRATDPRSAPSSRTTPPSSTRRSAPRGGIAASDYRIAEDGELRKAFDLLVEMGLVSFDSEQDGWVARGPDQRPVPGRLAAEPGGRQAALGVLAVVLGVQQPRPDLAPGAAVVGARARSPTCATPAIDSFLEQLAGRVRGGDAHRAARRPAATRGSWPWRRCATSSCSSAARRCARSTSTAPGAARSPTSTSPR